MDFNWVYIIPILTFLIFIHELGHFMAARRAGMKVEEFGFGLPPRAIGIQKGETIYSVNWIPLGGFVRVLGEDGKNFDERSMQAKSAWQRIVFITAGSAMNFLTAFVLIGALLAFQGRSTDNVYVLDVVDNSPAAAAGWLPGDRFISANGESVDSVEDIVNMTRSSAGDEMTVVLERGSEEITSTIVPRENPPEGEGSAGVRLSSALSSNVRIVEVPPGSAAAAAGLQEGDIVIKSNGNEVLDYISYEAPLRAIPGEPANLVVNRGGEILTLSAVVPIVIPDDAEPLGSEIIQDVQYERVSLLRLIPETIKEFFNTLRRMGEGLLMIIRGQVNISEIAGPIGMGQLTSEIIERSSLPLWVTLVNLTILLSLNLAILNLLPLPALDGGRLMFVLLEIARRGRRIAPEKEGMVHFVGLIILLGFMIVVAVADIDRIVSGNSLIQ